MHDELTPLQSKTTTITATSAHRYGSIRQEDTPLPSKPVRSIASLLHRILSISVVYAILFGGLGGLLWHSFSHTKKTHHARKNTLPQGDEYLPRRHYPSLLNETSVNIAFLGDSLMYFNDLPRFVQVLGTNWGNLNHIYQNSCLRGGASLAGLFRKGNAMYDKFHTNQAIISNNKTNNNHTMYDYGACTVSQLLTGVAPLVHEPHPVSNHSQNHDPCFEDPLYATYADDYFRRLFFGDEDKRTKTASKFEWDFVVLNDAVDNPARRKSRKKALHALQHDYVPIFLQSKVVPVFLWTHAYRAWDISAAHWMAPSLMDIANATSLTGAGYRNYARLVSSHLPPAQKARIAPAALAFLTVYEENRTLWTELFNIADHVHSSPAGTFLEGLVLYHTITGQLPPYHPVDNDYDDDMLLHVSSLFESARMMQHRWEVPNPMVTPEQAKYLYDVSHRVVVQGHIPSTYIHYPLDVVATEREQA